MSAAQQPAGRSGGDGGGGGVVDDGLVLAGDEDEQDEQDEARPSTPGSLRSPSAQGERTVLDPGERPVMNPGERPVAPARPAAHPERRASAASPASKDGPTPGSPAAAPATPTGARASRLTEDDRAALRALLGDDVRFDEPMRRHSTLKLGGPADALAEPGSVEALRALVSLCVARGLPLTPIGAGSNLLVKDGGVRGVVLGTRGLRGIDRVGATGIRVEAGVSTGKLLKTALAAELGGLEFLGGVPGSVGGGMIMNAGTYLGEFTNVTREVTTVRLADGELVVRDHAACGFVYRGSAIGPDEVVVEAALALTPRPRAEMDATIKALRQRRHEREPHKVSNAGSTFKNPPGEFAGRLIEACGLKGTRVGDAEVSPAHANWLVNNGDARAADLLALIELVRARVLEVHGVALALEVKVIGEDLADDAATGADRCG